MDAFWTKLIVLVILAGIFVMTVVLKPWFFNAGGKTRRGEE